MKKTLLAGVATGAVAIVAPANAADLRMPVKAAPIAAPAPYFSWTGCYIGPHLGWGWGSKDISGNQPNDAESSAFIRSSVDTSGAIFGGQLGCNYQLANNFVIGIEGSVSAADINGFNIGTGCSSQLFRVKTDFLGSVTGRIGWNGWNPAVLFYFKGGVGFAHDRYEHTTSFAVGEQDRTGWTIGLGVEWAFAPNWSAFVEWDYYDFGTKGTIIAPFDDPSEIAHVDISQHVDTVRLGLNYRFDFLFGKAPFAPFGKGPIAARY